MCPVSGCRRSGHWTAEEDFSLLIRVVARPRVFSGYHGGRIPTRITAARSTIASSHVGIAFRASSKIDRGEPRLWHAILRVALLRCDRAIQTVDQSFVKAVRGLYLRRMSKIRKFN